MLIYLVSGVLFLWLLVLSFLLYNTRKHYFNLVSTTRKQKIDEILDELLKHGHKLNIDVDRIKKELDEIVKTSRLYFQKVGIVRFNPFSKIGGEQSFVLSILDKENNGVVLNFIYTHQGVRVYTKRVKNGSGEEYQLSGEEKEAVAKSK